MPHVAFLLHPRTVLSGLAIPAEMLRAADELSRVRDRRSPALEITVATTDDRPTSWLSTLDVIPNCCLDELERVDLLFVPPCWRKPGRERAPAVEALARLANAGALVCAISTGSYLLAQTGLLDGRAATTHWSFFDDFAHRFPAIELKRHHLITRSGPFYCAGGLNALADLTTHLSERLYDAEIASRVAAQFSPESRRPFEEQSYFDTEPGPQPDELMAEAHLWLRERLDRPVTLADLARALGISRRSLSRRFREAAGRTPVRFLQELRIAEASELLRNTNLLISEIAIRVGYEDAAYFATLFRRFTAHTPSQYRAAVRGKLFTP